MTLENKLRERGLPDLLGDADAAAWPRRRGELLAILSRDVYGVTPEFDGPLYSFTEARDGSAHGGKAVREWIRLSFLTPAGMYSFPFQLLLPGKEGPLPAIVHIAFQQREQRALSPGGLDEFLPVEELLDEGYAVANLFYEDVTSDSPARDGLAAAYPEGENGWGKLGMWAFAASRVMDYLSTRGEIDGGRVAVCGWSRLGKTALWCGAQDERFALVASVQSGCGGAAVHRGKAGEGVREITGRFGYWFSRHYASYVGREADAPFDQHFLLACIAPRSLLVTSAGDDGWADPVSEYLGAVAASAAYRLLGAEGLIHGEAFPQPGQPLFAGRVGYALRSGDHGISRDDWRACMDFWRKRLG